MGVKAPLPALPVVDAKGPAFPFANYNSWKDARRGGGISDHVLQQYPLPRRNIIRRLKGRSEGGEADIALAGGAVLVVLTFHLISTFFLHV